MSDLTGARIPAQVPDGPDPLAVRDVTAWIQQWSRTLKTWRLYGEHNPTLEKFRSELASGLEALLETWGPVTLRFTTDNILWRETSVHQARTREDNLSRVFFRDGIAGSEPVSLPEPGQAIGGRPPRVSASAPRPLSSSRSSEASAET